MLPLPPRKANAMNLAKEITILSDAFWAGTITVEQYYELCDILIETYKLER